MITFEYVKHLIYNIMSLEFNPRANDHKFYGTTIGQFTEEEMRNGYAWSILNENSNISSSGSTE